MDTITTDTVTWSDESQRIFGLNPGDLPGTAAAYLSRVHAEDRPLLEKNIGGILSGAQDGYAIEHRIVWPDGGVRWLECTAR